MHTLISIIIKGKSENDSLKKAHVLIEKICVEQSFDYAILMDDKKSIVFGEKYLMGEIIAFDKIGEDIKKNDYDLCKPEFGKDRYGKLITSLKLKTKSIYPANKSVSLGAFCFATAEDKEQRKLGFPPRLYDYKGRPVSTKNDLTNMLRNMDKVCDPLNKFYLMPIDVHFETTRQQMRYADRELKKLPEFEDKIIVGGDIYIDDSIKEGTRIIEEEEIRKKANKKVSMKIPKGTGKKGGENV